MEGDLVSLTMLGKACGYSSLSFESSLRLVDLMRGLDESPSGLTIVGRIQIRLRWTRRTRHSLSAGKRVRTPQ